MSNKINCENCYHYDVCHSVHECIEDLYDNSDCYVDKFEIENALEKQIPMKPKEYEDKFYSCKCGNVLMTKWEKYPTKLIPKSEGLPYCLNCGQRLDWSEP